MTHPTPRAIAEQIAREYWAEYNAPKPRPLQDHIAAAIEADRAGAPAAVVWRCYHCGFATNNHVEAKAHFGDSDLEPAACRGRWMDFHAVRAENAELRARIDPAPAAAPDASLGERLVRVVAP